MVQTVKIPGFIGGSYRSEAIYADVQRCINWYPEIVESGNGENSSVLYPTPGTIQFGSNPGYVNTGSPRGMIELNGQLFMVVGTGFYEIYIDGSFQIKGNVMDDGRPASMAANNVGQIFIAAGGFGYCYGVPEQVNVPPPAPSPRTPVGFLAIPNDGVNFFGCSQVIFLDDYFIVLVPNSSTIQVSAINDGTTWNGVAGVQVALVEGQADHLNGIIADKEFMYLCGSRRAEIWYDAGTIFPFQIQPGAFIEQGLGAQFTLVQADNTLFWLGQDVRGSLVFWRINGFNPIRVSTHATEFSWSQYSRVDDARAFSYQYNGHTFIVLTFPTGDATWVYDCATKLWHERTYTDSQGNPHACVAAFHSYAFSRHLVQSSQSVPGSNQGQVYEWRTDVFKDLVAPTNPALNALAATITRDRITPHLYDENKRYFCNYIELRTLTGVGLDGSPTLGVGVLPQVMLRISRDGGNTFGEEIWRTAGAVGNYMQRVKWNLPGVWRDGVLWFRVTDPVNWAVIDCYICGELGAN